MIHRGEIFKTAVLKTQIKITRVAKILGVSTRQIYKLYEKEHISNEDLLRYGKLLGYDFTKEIPELIEYMIIKEPQEIYITAAQFREKYYDLLEEHVKLLNELEKYRSPKSAPSEPSEPKVRQPKKKK